MKKITEQEVQASVPELRKIPAIPDEVAGYICPQCDNFGTYRETNLNSPYYDLDCRCDHPRCPVYRKEQALVHERLMKHAGISLDTAYGRLTFETWDDLPSEQTQPKKTARYAAEELCKVAGVRGLTPGGPGVGLSGRTMRKSLAWCWRASTALARRGYWRQWWIDWR